MQLQLKQKTTCLTNQEKIIRIMRWDEMQYSQFVYDTGLQYLELYIPTDRVGIDALSRSKIFWAWWRNHWSIRDADYLDIYKQFAPVNWELLYRQEHSPETLTTCIFPNAVVLSDSYATMIHDFNKSMI